MTERAVTITLTPQEVDHLERTTGEVSYLFSVAEGAFAFLRDSMASGGAEAHRGTVCILELCARAFLDIEEKEGAGIARFDRKLREAMAESLKPPPFPDTKTVAQMYAEENLAKANVAAAEIRSRNRKSTEPEGSADQ